MRAERMRRVVETEETGAGKQDDLSGNAAEGDERAPEHARGALQYQLQIDMQTLQPCGIEVWMLTGSGNFMSPAAESDLGVLRQAGLDACRLAEEARIDVPVAVSMASRLVERPDFADGVYRVLQESGIPAYCLELQVAESLVSRDLECVTGALRALRRLGVRVTLNGVGLTALQRLYGSEYDRIKLDRGLVRMMCDSPRHRTAVSEILQAARAMGVGTVAAGVATRAQWVCLQELGCDSAQGRLIAVPQPLEQIIERLQRTAGNGWGAWRESP